MSKAAASPYVGRFAPSPSGPLHLGSLVAAIASFLDAKANKGLWLMRMEDLDPIREPPQAASEILTALENLGLHWDQQVLYQSQRLDAYQTVLDDLGKQGLTFACICSRQQIKAAGGVYPGTCRQQSAAPLTAHAIRLLVADITINFDDIFQGQQQQQIKQEVGDFVIKRKDQLFAYQLAVVVDDYYQGITHIIRGTDLMESTARQIFLQQELHYPRPYYGHIPIIINDQGQKLSKQHFAKAIDSSKPEKQLYLALNYLGQNPPAELIYENVEKILSWAITNWKRDLIPSCSEIPLGH